MKRFKFWILFLLIVLLNAKVFADTSTFLYQKELLDSGIDVNIIGDVDYTKKYFLALSSQDPFAFLKKHSLQYQIVFIVCDSDFMYDTIICSNDKVSSTNSLDIVKLGNTSIAHRTKASDVIIMIPRDVFIYEESVQKIRIYLSLLKASIKSNVSVSEPTKMITLDKFLFVGDIGFLFIALVILVEKNIKRAYFSKTSKLVRNIVISGITLFFVSGSVLIFLIKDKLPRIISKIVSFLPQSFSLSASSRKALFLYALLIQVLVIFAIVLIFKIRKDFLVFKKHFKLSLGICALILLVPPAVLLKNYHSGALVIVYSFICVVIAYLIDKKIVALAKAKFLDIVLLIMSVCIMFFILNHKSIKYIPLFSNKDEIILPLLVKTPSRDFKFESFKVSYSERIFLNDYLIYEPRYQVIKNKNAKEFVDSGNYIIVSSDPVSFIKNLPKYGQLYKVLPTQNWSKYLYLPGDNFGYYDLSLKVVFDCTQGAPSGPFSIRAYRFGPKDSDKLNLFEFPGCLSGKTDESYNTSFTVSSYDKEGLLLEFLNLDSFKVKNIQMLEFFGGQPPIFLKDSIPGPVLASSLDDYKSKEIVSYFMDSIKNLRVEYKGNSKDISGPINQILENGLESSYFKLWSDNTYVVIKNAGEN